MSPSRSTTVPPPLIEERSIGGIDAQRCPETNSGRPAAGIRGSESVGHGRLPRFKTDAGSLISSSRRHRVPDVLPFHIPSGSAIFTGRIVPSHRIIPLAPRDTS